MAHNQGGGGGFDPRYHNAQYQNYYDPRYQQQPHPPPQQNFQIQIPMSTYSYANMQQHQQHHQQQQQQQPQYQHPHPHPQHQQQHQQQHQPQHQQQVRQPIAQSPVHPQGYPAPQQFYQQQVYPGQVASPQFHPSPVQHHSPAPQRRSPHVQQPSPHVQHQSPLLQHQSPLMQNQSPLVQNQALPPQHPSQHMQRQSPHITHQSPPIQNSSLPAVQVQVPQRQQHGYPSPTTPSMNGHITHRAKAAGQGSPIVQSASAPVPASAPVSEAAPAPAPLERSPIAAQAAPPAPRPPTPMNLDYTALMIDLAEKYFETAYGNGTKTSPGLQHNHDSFCRVVATGLACLDVLLGELKASLDPPTEAAIRLRYATVLYKETENFMDAEEMLSKGMILCDRYRLTDLKYNMQHLLARVTFLKNPKAAVRYLDGVIRDVEAVNHTPWIYAMRFLRVALSLQMSQAQETLTALSQLKVIYSMANGRKDHVVAAIANSIEAMVQLHRSTSRESIEQCQRALASSRSAQANSSLPLHQLTAMNYFVDVLCSVFNTNTSESYTKMVEMDTFLDQHKESTVWAPNGEFLAPLSQQTSQQSRGTASQEGIVRLGPNDEVYLQIQWLPQDEIYTLAYLLSSAVTMAKNPQDGQAESYVQQALKMLKVNDRGHDNGWRKRLHCQIQAQTIFALCSRSAWGAAKKELQSLKSMIDELPSPDALGMNLLVPFLHASIFQGTGETEKALELYTQPPLSLESAESATSSPIARDMAILSALNVMLIICLPNQPLHSELDDYLQKSETLILDHPSKDFQAAFNLVRAVSLNTGADMPDAESASMLNTKEYLQQSLQAAKRTQNNHICCITLNFMTWRYFGGVVGEQPVKSAKSGQALARKGQNSLWMSVADGLLADTLETQARTSEAETSRQEARDLAGKLPVLMQRTTDQPKI